MYGSGLGVATLDGMPLQIYYVVIAFSLFVFLIGVLGIIGTCMHSKIATIVFVILDLAIALVLLIIMIFVLLYANGITTTDTVDKSVAGIQESLEEALVSQAVSNPEVWVVTQEGFSCCGIDLNATYSYDSFGYSDANFTNVLQPGEKCAAGRAAILAIHAAHPTYSAEAESAASANDVLDDYFCKRKVSLFVRSNTLYIGIIAGFLILIQAISATAAIILLSKVSINNGGFVKPKEENGNTLAFGGPQVDPTSPGNKLY